MIVEGFNSMTIGQQEDYLVMALQKVHERESKLRKMLATVRGGKKVEIKKDSEKKNDP